MTDTTAAPAQPTYELDDGVAVITLDDGKANVLSNAVLEALEGYLDRAEADGARALLIVGREGKFCAGFDLAEMTSSVESMRALVARGARWMLRLYGLGIPTVAACTGHALAAGALTLLSCDLRIAADAPAKIGLNEVAIGLPLPKFAVELARDRLVKTHFTAATMGAAIFDPSAARDAGYIDVVVPADELLATARAEARRLAELRSGAYGQTKANARAAMIEATLAALDDDMTGFEQVTS